MKVKTIALFLVAILVTGLFAGCTPAPKEELKIGMIGPLSGDYASYGLSTKKGIEIAIDEINKAGGIDGKLLKLIAEDSKGVPADAALAANKLIDVDGVVAIMGPVLSGETKTVAELADGSNVIVFSSSATATGIPDISDFVFRNCLTDDVQAAQIIEYAVEELDAKKVAILYAKNDYGDALRAAAESKARDLQVLVAVESYTDGESDFSAVLTSIKRKQPDTLFIGGYYTEAARIAQQALTQDMNVQLLGADGFYSPVLIELGGDSVEGAVFTAGFYPGDPSADVQAFITAFKAKFNEDPDMFAAQAYDAMKIVAAAIDAGAGDPAAIRQAILDTTDYPGVSGKTSFQANGDVNKEALILKVENGVFEKAR